MPLGIGYLSGNTGGVGQGLAADAVIVGFDSRKLERLGSVMDKVHKLLSIVLIMACRPRVLTETCRLLLL